MKTPTQKAAQLKRLFQEGILGCVWISFTATTDAGINYLSGHNARDKRLTLTSDSHSIKGIEYKTVS